jgi:hypothetical protein
MSVLKKLDYSWQAAEHRNGGRRLDAGFGKMVESLVYILGLGVFLFLG